MENKEVRFTIHACKWLGLLIFVITIAIWLIFLHNNNFLVLSLTPLPSRHQSEGHQIHFVTTNEKDKQLHLRTACAIESASLHNPNSTITIMTAAPIYKNRISQTLLKISNIQFEKMNIKKIFQGTPLDKWYKRRSFKGGPFQLQHLSDAIRLAVLYKRGGVYFDTDIWSVRGISHLRNTVARESNVYVNGAVMIFDKYHHFLHKCMSEFAKNYNKFQFTAQGPGLLTRVLQQECGVGDRLVGDVDPQVFSQCMNVTVLFPQSFYPIPYNYWRVFFMQYVNEIRTLSYTFHLWNKLSSNETAKIGSGVLLELLAQLHCPKVYKLMQIKGVI